jgi:hypothetical protein
VGIPARVGLTLDAAARRPASLPFGSSDRRIACVEAPGIRYARSGDTSIAYAVAGDGPFDLVFVIGWIVSGPCTG